MWCTLFDVEVCCVCVVSVRQCCLKLFIGVNISISIIFFILCFNGEVKKWYKHCCCPLTKHAIECKLYIHHVVCIHKLHLKSFYSKTFRYAKFYINSEVLIINGKHLQGSIGMYLLLSQCLEHIRIFIKFYFQMRI